MAAVGCVPLFPRINSDFVEANITMPEGGSFAQSEQVMQRVVDAAESLKAEWNQRPEYVEKPAIGSILGAPTAMTWKW
ncbi:MAG: hypothetical protein CM15mP74_26010 [Halieaceae bacterium]|nr:MAG: hypothetical protein CM15mP74_26010 [Halieaceae bacterium]